jgi:hypothetical protein
VVVQGLVAAVVIAIACRARSSAKLVDTSEHGGRSAFLAPLQNVPPSGSTQDRGYGSFDPAKAFLKDAPFIPESYAGTRCSRTSEELFELWELDPRELAWLLANQRQVLARDLNLVSEPAGGLRVAEIRAGSFGAHRGLRIADVLLDINGKELDARSDLEDFLEDSAYSAPKGWRLNLLRDGKTFTIDYRAASSHPSGRREH